MVSVRVSRVNTEVLSDPGQVAGATVVSAEAAGAAREANTEPVLVSRVGIEVLSKGPVAAAATLVDSEVVANPREANSEPVFVSRVGVEALIGQPRESSVTLVDAEAMGSSIVSGIGTVEISRIAIEALSRRGSAGLVFPLDLADGIEVFLHNWADEAEMRTSWSTDVAISPVTGAESRRGLVLKPERTLDLKWQLDEPERVDRLMVTLRKLTDERIAVPLYMDQAELDQAYTIGTSLLNVSSRYARYFQGARIVIVQLDECNQYQSHSFHIIGDKTNDTITLQDPLTIDVSANSIVMPMMDMEVTLEARMKLNAAKSPEVTLRLREVAGASQLPPIKADTPAGFPTFEDKPIFTVEPDWINGITIGRSRQGQSYTQGRTQLVDTTAARSRMTHSMPFSGDREEQFSILEFFDTRRGRLRTFWLIDQDQTFDAAELDASGNFVGVSDFGDFDDFQDEFDYVGIVMEDGNVYVREVVTIQQVLTVFRLTVTPQLPVGLDVNDVVRIARARNTRFSSDEIVEQWKHTCYMNTRLDFLETLEEKDVTT